MFMNGWNATRTCAENYRSDTGAPASHPHYTWGALFPLIGVEALCDVAEDFSPRPYENSGITESITVRNIPFGGRLYRLDNRDGKTEVTPE